MLRIAISVAALGALAVGVGPVVAQPGTAPTTPREQVGIHTGDTATNGSAVIVTDRNGTHPEGYPGLSPVNRTSAAHSAARHRHHLRRHPTSG